MIQFLSFYPEDRVFESYMYLLSIVSVFGKTSEQGKAFLLKRRCFHLIRKL